MVADADMVQYHGAEAAQRFILTVMNMVSLQRVPAAGCVLPAACPGVVPCPPRCDLRAGRTAGAGGCLCGGPPADPPRCPVSGTARRLPASFPEPCTWDLLWDLELSELRRGLAGGIRVQLRGQQLALCSEARWEVVALVSGVLQPCPL